MGPSMSMSQTVDSLWSASNYRIEELENVPCASMTLSLSLEDLALRLSCFLVHFLRVRSA